MVKNEFEKDDPPLIRPTSDPVPNNPPAELSDEQKSAKAKADALLRKLRDEHSIWSQNRPNNKNGVRLTWTNLKAVFEMYKDAKLGNPNFYQCCMTFADFSNAEFLPDIRFSNADLDGSLFWGATMTNVDFSGCSLACCNFKETKAKHCNFTDVTFDESNMSKAEFTECNFDKSGASFVDFSRTNFEGSTFRNAIAEFSNFSDCKARNVDFSNSYLSYSMLIDIDLFEATMTGARLYGTARSDWNIEGVKCEYVYWDRAGKERFPPDNYFEEGEFTTQHRTYRKFTCPCKRGITPFDLTLATYVVDEINEADMGFTIRIDNASVRGLNPALNFIIESGEENLDEAKEAFSTVFDRLSDRADSSPKSSTKCLSERSGAAADTKLLMEIRALVKQGSAQGMNKLAQLKQFMEGGFQSTMEQTVKSAAKEAIQDYLAEKSIRSESEDQKHHRYLLLYSMGVQLIEVPRHELEVLRTALENLMGENCLVLQDMELDEMPENSTIRSRYEIFSNLPEREAFVALADLTPGAKADHKPKSLIETVCWNSSTYAAQGALMECAERLRFALDIEGLEDLPRPPLPSRTRTMVLPNKTYIKEVIKDKFTTISAAAAELSGTGENPDSIRKRISEVKKGTPVQQKTMGKISKVLDEPTELLFFDELIVKPEAFKKLREKSGLSVDILATSFGIKEPLYFNLLESAQAVSGRTMIAVQYHYKKIVGSEDASFEKLIDWDRTRAHHKKKLAYLWPSK